MVDQDVLGPDRCKTITAHLADAFRIARLIGRELQVQPVVDDQFRQLRHAEDAIIQHRVGLLGADLVRDELAQFLRRARLHPEAHDTAPPALLQHHFELADQVFGLFLDLDIAVAHDAEQAAGLFLEAGEQVAQEHADHVFQRNEPHIALGRFRQPDEAAHKGRQRHDPDMAFPAGLRHQVNRNRETEIGNERERVRRVHGQRCQHRKDIVAEIGLEFGAFFLGQRIA